MSKHLIKISNRTKIVAVRFMFVLALAGIATAVSCGDRSTTESSAVESGTAATEVEQFQETAGLHPNDDGVQTRLATLFYEAGRLDEAELAISSALSINPDNQEALVMAGVIASDLDQHEKVIEYLGRVAELNKDDPMRGINMRLQAVYYELGVAYSSLDRPDEAIAQFQEALDIAPTDADTYFQLGLALEKAGKFDAAINSLKASTRLVPNFIEAYEAMSRIFVNQGDQPRADWAGAMIDIANGKDELAIETLRGLLIDLPESVEVYLGMGLAFENVARPALASAAYENVMRLDPDNWLARQRLIVVDPAVQ